MLHIPKAPRHGKKKNKKRKEKEQQRRREEKIILFEINSYIYLFIIRGIYIETRDIRKKALSLVCMYSHLNYHKEQNNENTPKKPSP